MDRQARQKLLESVDLYPVITESFCAGRTSLEVCRQVLAGGARILQVREKELSKRAFFSLARAARELTMQSHALLIINDHVDIALAVSADGIHLGQDDLPLAEARKLAPDLLLGISTHNREEARQAEAGGADYVNIGPIFPTPTKALAMDNLGPQAIPEISHGLVIPFTVMGGITRQNLRQVLQQGARRIAMVTEITQAPDIAGRVRELREMITRNT
jgi:thiamine-phosphate pyrophosphorylase